MNKLKTISEISEICNISNTSASTVSISPKENASPIVVFIYRDNYEIDSDSMGELDVYRLREAEVLSMILEKRILMSRLFSNAIVVKDELNIMPIVMNSLLSLRIKERTLSNTGKFGDLALTFCNVHSPASFVKNTFIPFMEVTKNYLHKCRFVLAYSEQDDIKSVSVVFDNVPRTFNLSEFEKLLISEFEELSLRSLMIDYHQNTALKDNDVNDVLQRISEKMLLAYNENADEDFIIKQLISYYLDIARQVEPSLQIFRKINRNLYKNMLGQSMSPVSDKLIVHDHILNAVNKISAEYDNMFNSNMESLYSFIYPKIKFWDEQSDIILRSGMQNRKINTVEGKEIYLTEVYSGMFSSAMISPYFTAFIPYSINKIIFNLIQNEI